MPHRAERQYPCERAVAENSQEELRAGEYKVTRKSVTASKLDTTAFKNAMPDAYSAFARETSSRRFCVA